MLGPPHHDHWHATRGELPHGAVRTRHERTRRIHDRQAAPLRFVTHSRRHAVRAEQHGRAVRHVVQRLHEPHAPRLQIRHHLLVVHELMETADGLSRRKRKGARGFLDGRPHTHTETMRL